MIDKQQAAAKAVASIDADEWTKATVRPLTKAYFSYWEDDAFQPVAVEHHFTKPISGSSVKLQGYVDTIGYYANDLSKNLINNEHKTGSFDADSDWNIWNNLAGVSNQIDLYEVGCFPEFKIGYHQIDYAKMPSLKSKRLPAGKDATEPGTKTEILENKTYFGVPVSDATHRFYKDVGIKENPELLEIRIEKHINDNPEKYFKRFDKILRSEADRQEAEERLSQILLEQRRAEEDSKNGLDPYYKNSNSCYSYGSWCEYLPLCNGTGLPSEFEKTKTNLGTTSFSRLSVWNACRRKFKHKYLEGLRSPDHDPEALRKGSVFHKALEIYYIEISRTGENHVNH
ncbi:MAG: PD-(D/E)XK nuclease family protein [Opitutae bacterium]